MTTEQTLKKFKKTYERMQPSAAMRASGWKLLQERIDEEECRASVHGRFLRYAVLVFGGIALISVLSAGTVVASWNAKPGDALYPVKVLSEKLADAVLPKEVPPEEQSKISEPAISPTLTQQEDTAVKQAPSVYPTPPGVSPVISPPGEAGKRQAEQAVERAVQQAAGAAPAAVNEVTETVGGAVQGVQDVVEKVLPLLP